MTINYMMSDLGLGDTLRVFAQTIDSVMQARFGKLEAALGYLEQRLTVIESGLHIQPQQPQQPQQLQLQQQGLTITIPTGIPAQKQPTPIGPGAVVPHSPVGYETDHSWYALSVEHPSTIEDKSPEHLVSIMYRIVDSKAINVSKYVSTVRLDDTGKPILYMLLYVNRPSIQSHFIQRWNYDEKGTVNCRKLKRLELVVDEFRKLKMDADNPILTTYRARYPGVFVGARWGSVTQEFILERTSV
jgi:hypothetical protein